MYNRIGGKIKGLAKAIFIVEAIAAVITGIAFMVADEGPIGYGLLIMLLGPVIAWISSWLLYGFGELIDKACDIELNTRGGEPKSEALARLDKERIYKIERLRLQGLITEEEYQKAISKCE